MYKSLLKLFGFLFFMKKAKTLRIKNQKGKKKMEITIEDLTSAAIRIAEKEFQSVVRDTQKDHRGDISKIESYYEKSNCSWAIPHGYDESAGHKWCGVFLGSCFSDLSDELNTTTKIGIDPKILKYVFASTYRIQSSEKWKLSGHKKPKKIKNEDVRIGDIAIIRTSGKRPYGDHFTLVTDITDFYIFTIEGNAVGELGNGKHGEGVVKRKRRRSAIRNVVRPKKSWFTGISKQIYNV